VAEEAPTTWQAREERLLSTTAASIISTPSRASVDYNVTTINITDSLTTNRTIPLHI
jgi:hypothetical protein